MALDVNLADFQEDPGLLQFYHQCRADANFQKLQKLVQKKLEVSIPKATAPRNGVQVPVGHESDDGLDGTSSGSEGNTNGESYKRGNDTQWTTEDVEALHTKLCHGEHGHEISKDQLSDMVADIQKTKFRKTDEVSAVPTGGCKS
eukprot:1974106-Pyramimonas_sp.AAC.1